MPRKSGADQAELDAEETKEQAGRRQRECRRISDEHEENHAREHQGREIVRRSKSLQRLFVLEFSVDDVFKRGDAFDDFRNALDRHQAEPDRQQSLTGQRISPPAFDDASLMVQDSTNHGQVK